MPHNIIVLCLAILSPAFYFVLLISESLSCQFPARHHPALRYPELTCTASTYPYPALLNPTIPHPILSYSSVPIGTMPNLALPYPFLTSTLPHLFLNSSLLSPIILHLAPPYLALFYPSFLRPAFPPPAATSPAPLSYHAPSYPIQPHPA